MTSDLEFLMGENAKRPAEPPPALISEYVEGFRVLPTNTPFPGFWENSRTPYAVEIMDNMGPFSPVQITDIMKGAQLGLTAAAENVIGYYMDPCPAEILYCSATDGLIEKWATKRLEPLIDSIGMRERLTATVNTAGSRRTGDKVFSKSYVGGNLALASAQSASGLRSDSIRVLVLDEIDGAPRELRTGEGNWMDVAMARTNAWGPRKKVLRFSTPTVDSMSLIKECYEDGDQRKFNVPCVHCGVLQVLEFQHLRHEMKAGQLYKVWYECPHCAGEIQNYHKTAMMGAGEWIPTAIPSSKNRRSYHLSSLYSPVGMLSWFELYEKYLEAKEKPSGMRSFVNLYLGRSYKETGSRPKLEKVIALRGEYREKEVQDGVLFTTAGADVQRGSENDPNNPARIEMEIVGHGAGFRTWSLAYLVFEGGITDPFDGAWAKMHDWAVGGGLQLKRPDGRAFTAQLVFIDSGDGVYVDAVYGFTSRWQNCYPSKGFGALSKRKQEKGDETGPHNFKRYRIAKSERSGDVNFVEVSTNYYKTHIYNNLKIERRDFEPQRSGFCDFPRDRGEKFFKMLTAEEKYRDGSFHAGGRRNEALDCRVLNICAGDLFLDSKVGAMRLAAKTKGASDIEVQAINHKVVLDILARQTARLV